MQAEIILKAGRVIDPASGTEDILDVSISGNKILQLGKNIEAAE